ncbi:hypothetical protein C2869_02985 [Saccharobesus litoralis]|uniref:Uncharacterized protein n=1 Tax=Saccharobesus litoralis TaxID=2172099 RepID=A0A2S0VML9_9ALTE|nr:hypothetical protein [Saccharobesus litoralis]AWB65463.1 hypothetical protein C2869_02985 [Saccharobesus litoralis]
MSTEPLFNIQGKHFLASLLGALASMAIPLCFVLLFGFAEIYYPPENPENDGYLRGFAVFLGFMPILFFSYLTYFILLSIKQGLSFKVASVVSTFLAALIGLGFARLASLGGNLNDAIITGALVFTFFATSLFAGTWAWHRKL